MTRTTRNIVIGLAGSVVLATCCVTSGCLETEEERQERLAAERRGGARAVHRSSRFWPGTFWWSSPRYSQSSPSVGRSAPHGSSHSSSPSHSSHSVTSRGGFGSSGHAVSGG